MVVRNWKRVAPNTLSLALIVCVAVVACLVIIIADGKRGAMQAFVFFNPAKPPVVVKAQLSVGDRVASERSMAAKWSQKTVVLPPLKRGCHIVTPKILKEIEKDLSEYKCGLAHLFLQHTSASLTINENYDPDVQDDTETFLNKIVPEGRTAPWKHTMEGPDDMPAHIKSSMFGCSLTIPITNGRLNMGTWQNGIHDKGFSIRYGSQPVTMSTSKGIWLCEHRDHATARKVVVTMNGV